MKRIVLIDADIELYQISQQHQVEVDWGDGNITMSTDLEHAKEVLDEQIKGIMKKVEADEYILCLTGANNFRKKHFPTYKSNRVDKKPLGYSQLKAYAMEAHPYKIYDELEADDVMGIMATKKNPDGIEYVIHSDDKDMRTIPALYYDRFVKKVVKITEIEALRFLYYQILKGDITDGYKGCPNVGELKAKKALATCTTELQMREAAYKLYCKAYKDDSLAKEKMIEQAGQARILRSSDFDFKTKQVIIWSPWRENGNVETGSQVQQEQTTEAGSENSVQSIDQ